MILSYLGMKDYHSSTPIELYLSDLKFCGLLTFTSAFGYLIVAVNLSRL